MNIYKCSLEDYDRIKEFYKYVIDNTAGMVENAMWIY